jgi:hypothetical protein
MSWKVYIHKALPIKDFCGIVAIFNTVTYQAVNISTASATQRPPG